MRCSQLWSQRVHAESLFGLAYSPVLQRAATAGDGGVKIIDMANGAFRELTAEAIAMDTSDDGRPHLLQWSPDGQILTVSTRSGYVYNFLAKMPMIHSHYGTTVAYLSSLREIAIADTLVKGRPVAVTVGIEPTFTGLGKHHVAAGMNNRILYYRSTPDDLSKVSEQEYMGKVAEVCMNDRFAAVRSDEQVSRAERVHTCTIMCVGDPSPCSHRVCGHSLCLLLTLAPSLPRSLCT